MNFPDKVRLRRFMQDAGTRAVTVLHPQPGVTASESLLVKLVEVSLVIHYKTMKKRKASWIAASPAVLPLIQAITGFHDDHLVGHKHRWKVVEGDFALPGTILISAAENEEEALADRNLQGTITIWPSWNEFEKWEAAGLSPDQREAYWDSAERNLGREFLAAYEAELKKERVD